MKQTCVRILINTYSVENKLSFYTQLENNKPSQNALLESINIFFSVLLKKYYFEVRTLEN